MADNLYGLSASDVAVLKRLIHSHNNRTVNTPNRPVVPEGDWHENQQTEGYVVKSPGGGIPALFDGGSEAIPGSALCEVYRITLDLDNPGGYLVIPTVVTEKLVFNLSGDAIPANVYAFVDRDKFGNYLINAPAVGATLTTANTDGTEASTTTRLEFDKTTGVRVEEDGSDPDVVSLIGASVTQQGAVSLNTFMQNFEGTKTTRGSQTIFTPNAIGPHLQWGVSTHPSTSGQIIDYIGTGTIGRGGLVTYNFTGLGSVMGLAVQTCAEMASPYAAVGKYAFAWLHPDLVDVNGVHRMCWVVGDPFTSSGGCNLIPPGFAVSNTAGGEHVGIDRNFASGEWPVVRGGIVVGYATSVSPPAPPVPPDGPPVSPPPPPPPPPSPPGTASLAGHIVDMASGDPVTLVGRTITLSGANTATTTTNSGGWYEFGSLATGATSVTLTEDAGETTYYGVDGTILTPGNAAPVTLVADTLSRADFYVFKTAGTGTGTYTAPGTATPVE